MKALHRTIVILAVICMTAPANAIYTCVDNTYTGNGSGGHSYGGKSRWEVLSGGVSTVEGIGVCVLDGEKKQGSYNDKDYNATRCLCVFTYPTMSNWVQGKKFSSNQECVDNCAESCATITFRDTDILSYVPREYGIVYAEICPEYYEFDDEAYSPIKNDALTVAEGSCPSGTVDMGLATSCDGYDPDHTDGLRCYLYKVGDSGSDSTGKYTNDGLCWYAD